MQTVGAVEQLLSLYRVNTGRKIPSALQKLLPFMEKYPNLMVLYTFEAEIYLSYHLQDVNKVCPGVFTALERALKHLKPYRIIVVQNTHGVEKWKIVKFVPCEIAQSTQHNRTDDTSSEEKSFTKRAKIEDQLEFNLSDDEFVFPESSLIFAPAFPYIPEPIGHLG